MATRGGIIHGSGAAHGAPRPTLTSVMAKRAWSAATHRSHVCARRKPPAEARPLTAASVGLPPAVSRLGYGALVTESQKVEQAWETPSLEEIPVISRAHVEAMEASDDPNIWAQAGMHHVVIRTVGRKTGKEHKVALPMWRDPKGQPIVVGSFAGAPGHPSWFINLRDRAANPEVLCRVQGRQYWSVPDILEGDEYRRIWDLLTADRA